MHLSTKHLTSAEPQLIGAQPCFPLLLSPLLHRGAPNPILGWLLAWLELCSA